MSALVRRDQVTGIVLAGGRSNRFGADKLAATIDGDTLLELSVGSVDPVAGAILIAGPVLVAGPQAPRPNFRIATPVQFIDDAQPFAGPLAALAGALREAATEFSVVVGGDMPGLVSAVLVSMLERLAADAAVDAVVLESASAEGPRKLQVLPVALRVGPASVAARAALIAGDRSLVRFLGQLRVLEVLANDWLTLDPEGESTLDIDVFDDLARFRGRKNSLKPLSIWRAARYAFRCTRGG